MFENGRADFKASGLKFLNEFAGALLAASPTSANRKFIVNVHVDDAARKRVALALELGSRRAVALVDKLTTLGIKPEQLVTATVGPYDPTPADRNGATALGLHAIEITIQPSAEDAVNVPASASPPGPGSAM